MYITDKLNSYIHNIFSIQYTYVIKKIRAVVSIDLGYLFLC